MKKNRKPYNFTQLASAIFMILALVWLTVSAPFVYANQQKFSKLDKMINVDSPSDNNEEEASNPFSNTSEEKNSTSSSTFSEEYMHDLHVDEYFFSVRSQYYKCENADTYIAYHGELLVPPPNAA